MKQPYKIQNRTSESRRVKFVKNGGTVSFPKTATASFIENSRDAGFCLTAITPVPPRDNATNSISLTSHPMGTDGRVSLFVNDTLIESKRFLNKGRIVDRQAWFNSEFGAYAIYSGKEIAKFTTASVSPDVYRFVFEDDDLDYVFGGTTNAAGDVNPTLVVEQYRLAFNLMNNKIEISCDGAQYESPYMTLSGDWELEINGVKYTTLDTPIEEMLALIEETEVDVVYEGDEPDPETEVDIIKDYTLTGWYNPALQRFEGFVRPNVQFEVILDMIEGDPLMVGSDVVTDGQGRWHYARSLDGLREFVMVTYHGDVNDPDNFIQGETLFITDFTLPDYRKADGDIIPTYEKTHVVEGDVHLYFKIGNGAIQKEQLPLIEMYDQGDELPLNTILATFANDDWLEDGVGPLGEFFMNYTNSLGLLGQFTEVIEPTVVDFTFLTPKPGRVVLGEPVSVTLYRGLTHGSTDLFDILFPNVKENYVTLTATATVDGSLYTTPTPSIAVTEGEVVQFCNGPFGKSLRIIDTNNIDNLKVSKIQATDLLNTKGLITPGVDYSKQPNWYMNYSKSGDALAISINGYMGMGEHVAALYALQRTAPGTYDFTGLVELGDMSSLPPTITDGYLGWPAFSNYQVFQPSQTPGSYDYVNDWGFGAQVVATFEIGPHMQLVLVYRWLLEGPRLLIRQVQFVPLDNNFIVTETVGGFAYNTSVNNGPFKPTCINISETHTLLAGAGTLVLVTHSPTNDVPPEFSIIDDLGSPASVVEVSRTETEVYFIITDILENNYRFVAMDIIELTTRVISTSSVFELGGNRGFHISDKVVMFTWDQYPANLTFSTFDLDMGFVSNKPL